MAIPKIVLFYAFTALADPEAMRLWQRDLCESYGLRGRILISRHGINVTVGGDLNSVKKYVRKTREYPAFTKLDVKWSDGSSLDASTADAHAPHGYSADFPRLSVKVRDEIVTFDVADEIVVNEAGIVGGGIKLKPNAVHTLVRERGDDVVFFDGRNSFEAEIGRFTGAVVPDVSNTREFVAAIDAGTYDHLKDKTIVTYCTGGVRCEVLSLVMKNRGFNQVYQLDGGIARYGETFGDDGLWQGSLYVFDNRMSLSFSDHAAVIGTCFSCATATSAMQNCGDTSCRTQLVVCESCAARSPQCARHGTSHGASAPISSPTAA